MFSLIFLMFLVSGFCGLLYQLVWLRLAFAAFGIITPVFTVVISVFMLGLAIGSWYGGRAMGIFNKKEERYKIIFFYALAEFLIGIGGLIVPLLFNKGQVILLPFGNFDSPKYLILSALVLGASILPWCACMGATTPLMMAFIRQLKKNYSQSFSYLYLANTIGAMLGVVITAIFLIELFGFRQTLILAASLNFFLSILASAIGLRYYFSKKESSSFGETTDEQDKTIFPKTNSKILLAILFITGFISMSLEVVWTRAFTPVLKTTVYSFAAVLAVYLLSTWIGAFVYRRHSNGNRAIDNSRLLLYLSFSVFLPMVLGDPAVWRRNNIKLAVEILLSIVPFCVVLGYLTPKIIDELSCGKPLIAGRVYAVNIVGCILGPLCTGYLLLPFLGLHISSLVLFVPLLVFALLYLSKKQPVHKAYFCLSGIFLFAIFFAAAIFLSSYEESTLRQGGIVKRDYVATIVAQGDGMLKRLFVNGIFMTNLSPITKCMAHFPLAIREKKPESILVICLGMGTTFRSGASWGIETLAIELIPSVRELFGFYFDDAGEILARHNTGIIIDDGRRFLKRTTKKFDVITIDPPPPVSASGSSLLYSREFVHILKARLNSFGILAQWLPGDLFILRAVAKSMSSEFPYVRIFQSIEGWGFHLFASNQPFDMPSVKSFSSRLPLNAVKDLTEWKVDGAVLSPEQMYNMFLQGEIPLSSVVTSESDFLITDDRPLNEYFLLRKMLEVKE